MEPLNLERLLTVLLKGGAAIAIWGVLFLVIEAVIPWLSVRFAKRESASWRLQREVGFFKREFLLEYGLAVLNQALQLTLFVGPVYLLISVLKTSLPHHVVAPWIAELPLALQVFYAMLVMDLAIYAEHRFAHRFAWPFHAIHHAAREITWITAYRIHPGNAFTLLLFNTLMGWILGFSGPAWVIATTIVLFLGMFQHANVNWDWGVPFRYLIVSPNFHKWHHARREEAVVKNLCLVFPFLDLLFGTFYFPRDTRPTDFGIYDLPGEEPVEGGFLAQLWYPFGRCIRVFRSALGRR